MARLELQLVTTIPIFTFVFLMSVNNFVTVTFVLLLPVTVAHVFPRYFFRCVHSSSLHIPCIFVVWDSYADMCEVFPLHYRKRVCILAQRPRSLDVIMGGDLTLRLGGRKKFLGPNFRMTSFRKRIRFDVEKF